MVPGHLHGVERRERIHDRDHVRRSKLGVDEVDQRLAQARGVLEPNMVVIEEDGEQPDVLAGGFPLLVELAANRSCRFGAWLRCAGQTNQSEGVDRLRGVVFEHLEVIGLQVGHGVSIPVGDDDVDADDVDFGAEGRRLGLFLGRLLRLLLHRLLLCLAAC